MCIFHAAGYRPEVPEHWAMEVDEVEATFKSRRAAVSLGRHRHGSRPGVAAPKPKPGAAAR